MLYEAEAMETVDDIYAALQFIPADDRETWVKVGMALKSEMGDKGFSLWDYWSQSAPNYQERAAQLTWRSFKSGAITLASLFYLAQQNGYQKARKAPARPIPEKTPPPVRQDTGRYAAKLWLAADCDDTAVAGHPYAQAKEIDWAGGAGRGTASGRVIGKDADCIVVPIRNIETHKLTGVQCINPAGDKQTFGAVSGNALVLGNTLDKSLYWSVCEGWASAVSMVFHHLEGNGVAAAAFGKGNLDTVAQKLAEVYQPEKIRILREQDD